MSNSRAHKRAGPARANGAVSEPPIVEVAGAPPQEEPQPIRHPSVLVMRVPNHQSGQESLEIAELNGIDPLSVPTTLRLAAQLREDQLGVQKS